MPDLPPLTGGLVGYLGYDVVRRLERLPETSADDLGMPELAMMLVTDLAVLDHTDGTVLLIANAFGAAAAGGYDDAVARLDAMAADLTQAVPPGRRRRWSRPMRRRRPSQLAPGVLRRRVERIREHIRAGDAFQVVLAQRFELATASMPSTSTGCCGRPTPRRTCTCSASTAGRARSTWSAPRRRRWSR